jgi:hypothetical protein
MVYISYLSKKISHIKWPQLIVIVVITAVGSYMLVTSHAATPYASIDADKGVLTSGATKVADSSADDGNKVVFGSASSSSQTDCFNNPGACGYPDPAYANVGATSACNSLTASSSVNVTTGSETLSNLNINGTLTISAANVTVKNVCITDNGGAQFNTAAVDIGSGANNTNLSHITVAGANSSTESVEAGLSNNSGNPVTLDSSYVYNCGECVHEEPWTVTNSYIITNGMQGTTDHLEDFYQRGGSVNLQHDTLLDPVDQQGIIFQDSNPSHAASGSYPCTSQITVNNNLIAGGGYVFAPCGNALSAGTGSFIVTDNRFARCITTPLVEGAGGNWSCSGSEANGSDKYGYYPYVGTFGLEYMCSSSNQTWTGNFYDDNLSAVSTTDTGVHGLYCQL